MFAKSVVPEHFLGRFLIHLNLDDGYHLAYCRDGNLMMGPEHPTVAVPAALGACMLKVALTLAQGKGKRHNIAPKDMKDAEVTVTEVDSKFHVAIKFPNIKQAVLDAAAACCQGVRHICPVDAMLHPDLVSDLSFVGG